MAGSYAGERSETARHLDAISDMLDTDAGSSVRRAADRDAGIAARVSADLYLAFWAAVQTDRHDLALDLVDASLRYS
ncbi:hypothetical protein, partial [Enterococcus faecium]|uniref:hypothetical protein n=1 Tax=Enterococcus faecium TaxID=1352 RepID=UPI0034E95311